MADYLITGASGGMGAALCGLLASQGHRVWGLDRNPPADASGWTYIQADLTRPDTLSEAFEQVSASCGRLDGIVHAAGLYDLDSLLEMPEDRFVTDFDVNLFGPFRVNRLFCPMLAPGGRVVIITSELAPLHPLPFTGIYGVTKSALLRYAQALRMEAQLRGLHVIEVRCGAVDTGMLPESTRRLKHFCEGTRLYRVSASRFAAIVDRVESRRVPPERVARAISEALSARRPPLTLSINRNKALMLMSALPQRLQLMLIRLLLRGPREG